MPLVSREGFQAYLVWSGTESKHTLLIGVETGRVGSTPAVASPLHLAPAQADPGASWSNGETVWLSKGPCQRLQGLHVYRGI